MTLNRSVAGQQHYQEPSRSSGKKGHSDLGGAYLHLDRGALEDHLHVEEVGELGFESALRSIWPVGGVG